MTIKKETKAIIQYDDKKVIEPVSYVEVGGCEVNEMLQKVLADGDEEELREQLIKNSNWGCGC